jgi:hypothetical protein
MINIFNLFLFLCVIWAILIYVSGDFSMGFMVFGVVLSSVISIASWKLKIINKNFNFLFLNLGFYRHFLSIFFIFLIKFIFFLIRTTFTRQVDQDCLFQISPNKILNKSELSIFVATLSFIPGISYVKTHKSIITIYAVSETLFEKRNLGKLYHNIHKINDDSLI